MHNMVFYLGVVAFCSLTYSVFRRFMPSTAIRQRNLPPIIPIPEEEIYSNPRQAYEKAFKNSGSHIIGVRKKGRLEFIVDDTFLHEVLADNRSFSFQEGVMTLLNMKYLSDSFADYFERHDDLIRNAIINRLPFVINQVFPVMNKNVESVMRETNTKHVDAFNLVHHSLCEAMTKVILGADFATKRNVAIIQRMVEGATSSCFRY